MFNLLIKKPSNFKNDVLSGLTVALALVPEAVAFSFVAHVDPTIGLYAAFIMGLITAIFGGRPGMISGATGAVAVIFAPMVIEQTKIGGMDAALGYLFMAVILMGIIQVAFGVLKWGKLIRLIPHPVMLGFVNGLAIVIFKAQFSQFYVGDQLMPVPALAIMVGLIVVTMLISQFLPKLTKAVPATLAAILIVTGIGVWLRQMGYEVYTVLDFVRNMDPSKTTLAASLPTFQLPRAPLSLDTLKIIGPVAFLAAAVGLIESLMTLTLVDELTQTRGRSNKESIGQGAANILNGFFGGMGGCAMIGQSMINIRAGGRGRTSGIAAAIILLALVVIGAPIIEMIPLAALVGVMFMVVIATFEWSSFRVMRQIPRADALVIVVVSLTTVVIDLAVAVFVGVIISALVFAWEQGKKITFQTKMADTTKTYEVTGNLFFGSVSTFKEGFDMARDPDVVIIDFKNARVYDHSGLDAIQTIASRYMQAGKAIQLLNLSAECQRLIHKAPNIMKITIGEHKDHWYIADDRLE